MKILCICANGCNMDIFVARVNNYFAKIYALSHFVTFIIIHSLKKKYAFSAILGPSLWCSLPIA